MSPRSKAGDWSRGSGFTSKPASRKAASVPNFGYSPALKNSHIVWTDDNLKKWVAGPSKLVPGTRMVFAGLSNPHNIADLIAFLRTRK